MARKGGTPENLKPFKSGVDERRNIKGQPKKLPELEIVFAECLGDEAGGIAKVQKIIDAQIKKAEKGDTRAAEWLFDRGYGKVKQIMDMNVSDNKVELTIKTIGKP